MRKTTTIVLTVAATAMAAPSTTLAAQPAANGSAQPAADLGAPAHHRAQVRHHLILRATNLARRLAHARGHGFSPHHYRRSLSDASVHHLTRRVNTLHRALRRALRPRVSPTLQAIARCESGGDPHAIGGGGAFRGKYQFDYGTWRSVGGHGDPAAASEGEQDRRAAMLYARAGASPWPVCGR
jgi:hypothetical protein